VEAAGKTMAAIHYKWIIRRNQQLEDKGSPSAIGPQKNFGDSEMPT